MDARARAPREYGSESWGDFLSSGHHAKRATAASSSWKLLQQATCHGSVGARDFYDHAEKWPDRTSPDEHGSANDGRALHQIGAAVLQIDSGVESVIADAPSGESAALGRSPIADRF